MRLLGACAVLVGGLELMNLAIAAVAAARAGGSAAGSGLVAVVGVVSVVLVASGVALQVPTRASIRFARGAALAALIVFALAATLRSGLSIASMMLGIVFPIVMLLITGRRDIAESAPDAR